MIPETCCTSYLLTENNYVIFKKLRRKNHNQKYVSFVEKYLKRMPILKDTKERIPVTNHINVINKVVIKRLLLNAHWNIMQSLIWVKWNELYVHNVMVFSRLLHQWKFTWDSIQVFFQFFSNNIYRPVEWWLLVYGLYLTQ